MLDHWLPQLGDVLADRYQIEAVLGEGGFGVVYRAVHLGLDRAVAIKMLLPHALSDRMAVARFQREIDLARRLRHPHTVQILDRGETQQGLQYYAMEFLEGRTLGDELATSGVLPWNRVRAIVEQVLGSLGEAHGLGIVHRDLKPGNIMLVDVFGRTDFVKVLDFGIGKAFGAAAEGQALSTRGVIGTPHYMSPEQAVARPDIDGRSDLYSLGIVMMELLGGRRPYEDPSAVEILMRHAAPEPVPIPPPLVNGPLGPILVKALEKDRRGRFADAAEMLAALQAIPTEAASARGPGALPALHPIAKLRPPTPAPMTRPSPAPATPATSRPAPAIILAPGLEEKDGSRHVDLAMRTTPLPNVGEASAAPDPGRARQLRAVAVGAAVLVLVTVGTVMVLGAMSSSDGPHSEGGEATPGATATGCLADGLAARPDGVHWFRAFSTWVTPGRFWLGDPISADEAGGAMAYSARFEGGRPIEVTRHRASGQPDHTLVATYEANGRLAGWENRDRYGYRTASTALRWLDARTVEIQQRKRSGAWDRQGCPWQHVRLDELGRPAEIECRDLAGVVVERVCSPARRVAEAHDACGFVTRWSFRDVGGEADELRCFSIDNSMDPSTFVGEGRWPADEPGCDLLHVEPGLFGQVATRRCLNAGGEVVDTGPRPVESFEYNDNGALLRWEVLDSAGHPLDLSEGGFLQTLALDANGALMERCTVGCPLPTGDQTPCPATCTRTELDSRGHPLAIATFDENGAPTTQFGQVHRYEYENDDTGFATLERFRGVDGALVTSDYSELGMPVAEARCERNALGRPVDCTFTDADGQPGVGEQGVVRVAMRYDARGNRIERCHFGPQGEPVNGVRNAHCSWWDHDEADRTIRWGELGPDRRPIARVGGVAGWETSYDANGLARGMVYLAEDGRPTPHQRACRIEYHWDGLARERARNFLDCDGAPVRANMAIVTGVTRFEHAGWQVTYDQADRPVRVCTLDESGAIAAADEGGPACVERHYDASGPVRALTFAAADGVPVSVVLGAHTAAEVRVVREDGSSQPIRLELFATRGADTPSQIINCSAEGECRNILGRWLTL